MKPRDNEKEPQSSVPPLTLSPKHLRLLDAARKVAQSASNHALQIVPMQARVWAADDDGAACRPWYKFCLELYPRGKVINHRLNDPVSEKPTPSDLLTFLLEHITSPPAGEATQRPTHVSFTDDIVADRLRPHLSRIKITTEKLTLADGVMDYVKKFSAKLVELDQATRSDAAERAGLLSRPSNSATAVASLLNSAVQMFHSKPWDRIPEHLALQIRLPSTGSDPYRERFYVTVLGSDGKVFGCALMASLSALRIKYHRVMSSRTGNGMADIDTVTNDVLVCATCGRRVGGDGSEVWVNRCTGCKLLLYCNEECQKIDWRERHRDECPQAANDRDYVFKREQWDWLRRELALLFFDPTAIPFDDLDAFDEHGWKFIHDTSPPLYPLPFVGIQEADGISSRRDLPTAKEIEVMAYVAKALTELEVAPPSDSFLHLANGVSISLAENLAESMAVPSL